MPDETSESCENSVRRAGRRDAVGRLCASSRSGRIRRRVGVIRPGFGAFFSARRGFFRPVVRGFGSGTICFVRRLHHSECFFGRRGVLRRRFQNGCRVRRFAAGCVLQARKSRIPGFGRELRRGLGAACHRFHHLHNGGRLF